MRRLTRSGGAFVGRLPRSGGAFVGRLPRAGGAVLLAGGVSAAVLGLAFRAGVAAGRLVEPFDPGGPGRAVGLVFDGVRWF